MGRYKVTGRLQENSCGLEALPTVDPMRFEVEIREEEGAAIWAIPDKPFLSGTMLANGKFSFRLITSLAIDTGYKDPDMVELLYDPEKAMEPRECFIDQSEVIEGTVLIEGDVYHGDAGDNPDEALSGKDTIEIVPTQGSICHDATIAAGGLFQNLPCKAYYVLSGELIEE